MSVVSAALTVLCLGVMALLTVGPVASQTAHAQEGFIDRGYKIKAVYLYHFGNYVTWTTEAVPAEPGKKPKFVIGIVGENPFENDLQRIADKKTLKERRIVVRSYKTAEDYRDCHILFVPAGRNKRVVELILKKTRGKPVLIVGESKGFAQRGGIINFYVQENKVKFEINSQLAEKVGLKVSAKLLRLGMPPSAER